MRPITMYEAEDGKLFRDEEECLAHDRRARLTDEVISQVKIWDGDFEPIRVSVNSLDWTETGQYFFAPDRECREAINYAFEEVGNIQPFVNYTENSSRVMWDDFTNSFIDFDVFCEENENRRRAMS